MVDPRTVVFMFGSLNAITFTVFSVKISKGILQSARNVDWQWPKKFGLQNQDLKVCAFKDSFVEIATICFFSCSFSAYSVRWLFEK